MASTPSFFLVWNPAGRNPHYRHSDLEAATTEAIRLADKNPGAEFYVVEVVRKVRRVSPVEVTNYQVAQFDDRLPF